MAGETDSYDGRRPSFGMGERGMFLRGFRSKPGAPMADPTRNKGSAASGFTSNWDSIFRQGASGRNTKYLSSFPDAPIPSGTGVAGPMGASGMEADPADIFAPGVTGAPASAPPSFSGTAPSHAQVWSAPSPRRANDSMPGAPYMPKGPDWKMQMPKMAGTYDALLDQNKALAAPGGMQGMLQPPKTYNQGWQVTSDDERDDIAKRFGWKSAFR